jgi:hypothetical protein
MSAPSNLGTTRYNIRKNPISSIFVRLQLLDFRVRDIYDTESFFQKRRAEELILIRSASFEVPVFRGQVFRGMRCVSEDLRVPEVLGIGLV